MQNEERLFTGLIEKENASQLLNLINDSLKAYMKAFFESAFL
jgi:hypothetical protein